MSPSKPRKELKGKRLALFLTGMAVFCLLSGGAIFLALVWLMQVFPLGAYLLGFAVLIAIGVRAVIVGRRARP